MGNDSNPLQLTASGTTTLGSVFLYGIAINQTLAGTIVVKEDTTTVGTIAAATVPGTYHFAPNGVRYTKLSIVLSGADNCTSFIKVA